MKLSNYLSIAVWVFLLSISFPVSAKEVVWFDGIHPVNYSYQTDVAPVVRIATDMFVSDMKLTTGMSAEQGANGKSRILIYQMDGAKKSVVKKLRKLGIDTDELLRKMDAFCVAERNGKIYAIGNNGRGTAYALLELSRMAGVSPWVWWGDNVPERKGQLSIKEGFTSMQCPSVERRGIFINDEDWSTLVWSHRSFEPSDYKTGAVKGKRLMQIGVQTYKKIFQLLLRLRGNMIWPAMHEGTVPFYLVEGAMAMADSCGIIVGTSHCEPMMRNNTTEWSVDERGRFNYLTNQEQVQDYWISRVKEVGKNENVYTIGMRGIHDGDMEGPRNLEEKTLWLQKVIDDQREMLRQYVAQDVESIPQAFVPYKEVLQIYENGLRVPEDVTLIWCDDNYGYMTRLSNEEQQARKGGSGVYYHLSYWGRPHDYLWLTCTQPGLIYQEMSEAYRHGARKQWIVNVHDVKVASYDLELFLDMAWNYASFRPNALQDHLHQWLCREFGQKAGDELLPVMKEFYRLTAMRKPEFMGWNQVELDKKEFERGMSPVQDTEFSFSAFGNEADRYLERYDALQREVERIGLMIRPAQKDAYFAAIQYRVEGAAMMAKKQLEAQRARSLAREYASLSRTTYARSDSFKTAIYMAEALSQDAYDRILQNDKHFNEINHGKWRHLMLSNPRNLLVFQAPTLPDTLSEKRVQELLKLHAQRRHALHPLEMDGAIAKNADQFDESIAQLAPVQMLGHSMNAVPLPKDEWVSYSFQAEKEGDYALRIALIPTQPLDKGDIRFSVSIDDGEERVFSLKEAYRSEQWKLNVLRGQTVRTINAKLSAGKHQVVVKALDEHIILDQLMLDPDVNRQFYLFPTGIE
ncbi:MAG: glycosyl hydrolase 115 family protein [Bacteroidaceae bacterium]|nr:glycosyl hydrolase 115 family protein [Bacteroidaceae bacterium]